MNFRVVYPLFLAAAAVAQPAAEPKPATVEGMVLNSVTNAPLRKVDLSLENDEVSQEMAAMMQQFKPSGPSAEQPKITTKTFTASTDAAGKFRFENVPPGTWYLTAEKLGFGDERYSPKGSDGGLRLAPGDERKNVDFRMVPQATLSGRVVDKDGESYPTAMVSAMTYQYGSGRRRLTPVDLGQTNNRGEFSLSKIPPGHYFLLPM
jgi:hypothetical protein